MIPKRLHLCWLSGDPFPPLIQHCVESWKRHLPDYEIVRWDSNSFDLNHATWVREAFNNKKYAFAADYIRLFALHKMGGIYLDADVEVTGSFEDLLFQSSFMGYESSGDLEPAVIGAVPGLPWLEQCLGHYRERRFVKPDGSFDMKPLPLIIHERLSLCHELPVDPVTVPTRIDSARLTLYPASYFSPKNAYTKRISTSPETRAIHHFDGHWVKQDFRRSLKNCAHRVAVLLGEGVHRKTIRWIRKLRS
jgi:mannosyltransferase OCH1-like enzyme